MNMKASLSMACLLIGGLIIASTYAQDELMLIDNSVFENPERPPAVFPHDSHNEKAGIEECNECHHIYEDGVRDEYESSEDQMCSECHEFKASDNKLPLMKAFHQNCKGCHTEKKSGPVMCGECHKNENRA
jgi:hypothetical protein